MRLQLLRCGQEFLLCKKLYCVSEVRINLAVLRYNNENNLFWSLLTILYNLFTTFARERQLTDETHDMSMLEAKSPI